MTIVLPSTTGALQVQRHSTDSIFSPDMPFHDTEISETLPADKVGHSQL
jgi:hypothetical protein